MIDISIDLGPDICDGNKVSGSTYAPVSHSVMESGEGLVVTCIGILGQLVWECL